MLLLEINYDEEISKLYHKIENNIRKINEYTDTIKKLRYENSFFDGEIIRLKDEKYKKMDGDIC